MKKIIVEIIFIIFVSSAIGLIYNIFSDNKISLIHKSIKDSAVPDSVLFNNKNTDKSFLEKIVTYNQIVKLLNKPDVLFIDARRPDQYKKGHIGNAINIFPLMNDENKYYLKLNELPRNKILIVYCDGGSCDLSEHVVKDLYGFGYYQCFLFKGGWAEWKEKRIK